MRYQKASVMKVLFVEVVSEMGGAQRSLYEICTALPSFGVEVVAAVPPGPLHDALQSAGVSVYPVQTVRPKRRGVGLVTTVLKLFRASRQTARIIRACKPDIIHANSVASALATQNAPPGIPFFLHVRDLRLPAFALNATAKQYTRIIAISAALDAYLRNTLGQPLHEKIRIIRNGIDTAHFTPGDKSIARKRFSLPEDVPVIGMVAHLIPWKGHDLFLSAAEKIRAKFPTAQFVIVGRDLFKEHDAWVKKLHGQISDVGLQNVVHWIQDLEQTEKILPAFDVLVHPAKHEPFGRVVCEAMAMQVPVVAVNSGGIPEIIIDGVNGFLVAEDDADGIAERVGALLDNPAHAHTLACAAREHILQDFTKERVAQQLAREYRGE